MPASLGVLRGSGFGTDAFVARIASGDEMFASPGELSGSRLGADAHATRTTAVTARTQVIRVQRRGTETHSQAERVAAQQAPDRPRPG
jgi:hypothetical protein